LRFAGAYCLYASRVIIRHAPVTDQPTIQPALLVPDDP
jgi:hypothetical protein